MHCDYETLPSSVVHVRFRLICPIVEYTMLKAVLNKGTYQKNNPQSAAFAGNHEGGCSAGYLSLPREQSAKDAHGHLCMQCPDDRGPPVPSFTW